MGKLRSYNKAHCWQFEMKLTTLSEDLDSCNLSSEEIENIQISDLKFCFIDKSESIKCSEIKRFIERYEWLGTMPLHPTHRFAAYYHNILVGVVVMSMPNAFSVLLGKENRHMERLIARGASISWAPKNTASWLIMKSIRWMVHNTKYRLFVAYSDPEARELGTIYQACNFIYLGKASGTTRMFMDPSNPQRWFSDRQFRSRSMYKRYANELGIMWDPSWQSKDKIIWKNMPREIEERLRLKSKDFQAKCVSRVVPAKHKYCYILGRTQSETNKLIQIFESLNPTKVGLLYPKERGI